VSDLWLRSDELQPVVWMVTRGDPN